MDLSKEIKNILQNKSYPKHEKLVNDTVNILTKKNNLPESLALSCKFLSYIVKDNYFYCKCLNKN